MRPVTFRRRIVTSNKGIKGDFETPGSEQQSFTSCVCQSPSCWAHPGYYIYLHQFKKIEHNLIIWSILSSILSLIFEQTRLTSTHIHSDWPMSSNYAANRDPRLLLGYFEKFLSWVALCQWGTPRVRQGSLPDWKEATKLGVLEPSKTKPKRRHVSQKLWRIWRFLQPSCPCSGAGFFGSLREGGQILCNFEILTSFSGSPIVFLLPPWTMLRMWILGWQPHTPKSWLHQGSKQRYLGRLLYAACLTAQQSLEPLVWSLKRYNQNTQIDGNTKSVEFPLVLPGLPIIFSTVIESVAKRP